jgi:hypothetical protein
MNDGKIFLHISSCCGSKVAPKRRVSSELKKIETENFYCRALMRVSFALD